MHLFVVSLVNYYLSSVASHSYTPFNAIEQCAALRSLSYIH